MTTNGKNMVCYNCGNDTFLLKESSLGAFGISCTKCGEGRIFGPGLSARAIASILKGEDR